MSTFIFTLFLSLYCGEEANVPIKYDAGRFKASFSVQEDRFSANIVVRF